MAVRSKRPTWPCGACSSTLSTVARTSFRAGVLTRRRQCLGCSRVFVTREVMAFAPGALATGVIPLAENLSSPSNVRPAPKQSNAQGDPQ